MHSENALPVSPESCGECLGGHVFPDITGTSGWLCCAGGSGFECPAPLDVFTALTHLSGIVNLLPALPPSLQSLQWHGNKRYVMSDIFGRVPMGLADLKVGTLDPRLLRSGVIADSHTLARQQGLRCRSLSRGCEGFAEADIS